MTYPGGGPGGYPGQGPQHPAQGPGYGPPPTGGGGVKLGMTQILLLVGAGLGLVILLMGLAPAASGGGVSQSLYESGFGWLPVFYFVAGGVAASSFLPKSVNFGVLPAAMALGALLGQLFSFSAIPEGADTGVGFILILIFGLIEVAALAAAFMFEAGLLKPPAPKQPQYGHQPPPGGMYPPSNQFPAQQQPGQYPPQQPGGPPGQATTFAPQQGQFGQPGQQHPGTPPGGYPQQG